MANKSQPSGDISFGEKLKFSSTKKIDYLATDDKKAFEIRFDTALAAGVGTPVFDGLKKTKAPVSTQVYSAVVPAVGKNVAMSIVVNGFCQTELGANCVLMLAANDQHSATHFGAKRKDQAYTAALPFKAKALTDVRLTVVLIAERDSAHAESSALIAVNDISADAALKGKKRPARAPKPS